MLYKNSCSFLALLVLIGCFVSISNAGTEHSRVAWLHKTGGNDSWFQKADGKLWVEANLDGIHFQFEEVASTADYVEIFDSSRRMSLRIRSNRTEWRQGGTGRWFPLYTGRWVAAADLPQQIEKDYRIRLAYFVPADREPVADYAQKIRVVMQVVDEVYRQDFEARNIPSKGLLYEMRDDNPVVHLIRGQRTAAFYNGSPNYDPLKQWQHIQREIPKSVGVPSRNIIILFVETNDDGPAKFEWSGGIALGSRLSTEGGLGMFSAWILRSEFCATTFARQKELMFDTTPIKGRTALGHGQPNSPRFEFIEDGFGAVIHELGHALGLHHDVRRNDTYIMGNGFRNLRWNFTTPPSPTRRARFSDDNARILYSSRYLAPKNVLSDIIAPTVELHFTSPPRAGDETVEVTVKASDNAGLRAITFFAPEQGTVIGGRALTGKMQTFEQLLSVRPLTSGAFRLQASVVDAGGNLTRAELNR